MWWRALIGVVALGVGALWIGQGVGAVHGSFMTGHRQYETLGIIVASAGAVMIGWAIWVGRRTRHRRP